MLDQVVKRQGRIMPEAVYVLKGKKLKLRLDKNGDFRLERVVLQFLLLPPPQNISIFSYKFRQLCVQINS